MKETVSSTKAARNLGDLLARIRYRGDSFLLTKNETPIAELRPAPGRGGTVTELRAALARLPRDASFADDLSSVNETDQLPSDPWD
ncbi:MAG: hypothetical protein AAGJ81_03530 [Verrucomicrobiota bacterium]